MIKLTKLNGNELFIYHEDLICQDIFKRKIFRHGFFWLKKTFLTQVYYKRPNGYLKVDYFVETPDQIRQIIFKSMKSNETNRLNISKNTRRKGSMK